MARISHGRERAVIRTIRQNAQSANGKLLSELTAAERNALLAAALKMLGLVDNNARVDLSAFNGDG